MTKPPPDRILIVEDEALVALEMEDVLTAAGYVVVGTTDTLAESLAFADSRHPNLALCDIRLNGESGVEIARQLQERGIPSLFVTGNCAMTEGAHVGLGCLHKPFDQRKLLGAVAVAKAVLDGTQPPPLPDNMHLFQD